MFGKLKEKIGNWAKKVSEKAEAKETPKPKKELKKEKIKVNLEKLKETAEEIKKEIHLEPSLDKQLRGETVGEGLKYLEEEEEETDSFFKKIKTKISKIKISEKEFEVYSQELEMLLLENNVALEVAERMVQDLKQRIIGKELLKKEAEFEIKEAFKDIIREILIEPFDLLEKIKQKTSTHSPEPYVILFCGVNGSGKTTTIAKIADFLKDNKISSIIAAADTFRAASIEQIQEHGKKIGIKVISHEYESDPAAVGFDAIKYAEKNRINCVLIDTAGRMYTAKNLLREIEKISRVCKPDLNLFIGESITGNDAIEQAKTFNFHLGVDGIILTKADIDEKGGTALSVGFITKKPILFLGTGQLYDDIVPFNKEDFIKKLGL